jgi:hypothetical protein
VDLIYAYETFISVPDAKVEFGRPLTRPVVSLGARGAQEPSRATHSEKLIAEALACAREYQFTVKKAENPNFQFSYNHRSLSPAALADSSNWTGELVKFAPDDYGTDLIAIFSLTTDTILLWRAQCKMTAPHPYPQAAFEHLTGIHTLTMIGCPRITDAAFAHLKGVHTLRMKYCIQNTITDAAFAHLKGIHTLNMDYCAQRTITDAAFAHLKGIHTLSMNNCKQRTITDAAFAHLKGIHTLSMNFCTQKTITDAAVAHLTGIHTLHNH